MMGVLRRILEQIGHIIFVIAGIFAVLIFLAAQTGTPPVGTVMENCTVYGIENNDHPVELNPDDCERMLEKQKRLYGVTVPPVHRPEWAQFILGIAELPLRFFR
ncbi:MAG: hypothetical protein D4R48_01285 [Nitrosomonadales bacterium]|nr:MAG: hypothetical protein D4R48_01285 [Nitrosomonadales bacterium]